VKWSLDVIDDAFTYTFSELSWISLFWQTKVITSKTQCSKHMWEFAFTNSLHKLALIYLNRTCWILNVRYGDLNCILFFRDAADVVVDVVNYWRMDLLLCEVWHSFDVSCLQDVYFKFSSCHTLRPNSHETFLHAILRYCDKKILFFRQ